MYLKVFGTRLDLRSVYIVQEDADIWRGMGLAGPLRLASKIWYVVTVQMRHI